MSDWAHHNPAGPAVVHATLSGCGHQGRTAGQVPVAQAGTFPVPAWAAAATAVPASPTLSGPSVRVATLEERRSCPPTQAPDLADGGRRGSSQAADAAVNRAATARPDARSFLLAAHRQLFPGRVEQSPRAATGAERSLPSPRNLATVAGTVVVPTAGRRNFSVLQQQAPAELPGGSRGTPFARAGSARAASATPLVPVTSVPGEAQCTVGAPGGNLQGAASESPAPCRWNARAQSSAASGHAKLQNDDSAAETCSTHCDAAAVQVST
uniref:Endochitinase A1-like isoform X2 n=1 Tax=Petromyzon marinus TaxID=7757 RepID=A0AAJ7U957_PETMA|nr:endochitinase A1-like isoform X2 [Petromyzon marinus]